MRFQQPVGVIQQNNDYISINLINSESNQITRLNGNNSTNATETLNLQSSENTNNFDSKLGVDKTTTSLCDIFKLKSDSKYFTNYFGSQLTDTNNIDLSNGNNDIILIETLKFTKDNLSKVRLSYAAVNLSSEVLSVPVKPNLFSSLEKFSNFKSEDP